MGREGSGGRKLSPGCPLLPSSSAEGITVAAGGADVVAGRAAESEAVAAGALEIGTASSSSPNMSMFSPGAFVSAAWMNSSLS